MVAGDNTEYIHWGTQTAVGCGVDARAGVSTEGKRFSKEFGCGWKVGRRRGQVAGDT